MTSEPLTKNVQEHSVLAHTIKRGMLGIMLKKLSYGISSGRTSARMLMESVFALDVGAAARRIFSRAIYNAQIPLT